MLTLTLPDTRTRYLPTRWGEVTLGQYAQLAELPDGTDHFSYYAILLCLSPIEVMNLPADFMTGQVLPVLEFAEADALAELSQARRPTVLHMRSSGGGLYDEVPVPTDLTASTYGQACDLGDVLRDSALSLHQKRIRVLAILMHPHWQKGPYDHDAIDDLANYVCVNVPMEEGLPLTDFFLLSSTASTAPTLPSSSASLPAPTRKRRGWSSWWPTGMRWPWLTRWLKAIRRDGPTSSALPGAR